MNRFQKNRLRPRAPGMDHLYRSEFVIWYNNGALACGPRVPEFREFLEVRGKREKHVRRLSRNFGAKCNMPRIFGNKYPF